MQEEAKHEAIAKQMAQPYSSNASRRPHRNSPPYSPIGQHPPRSSSRSRKHQQHQNPGYDEPSTMADSKRLISASTQAAARNNTVRDPDQNPTNQESTSATPESKSESDQHKPPAATLSYSQAAKSVNATTSTGSADPANRRRSSQQNSQATGSMRRALATTRADPATQSRSDAPNQKDSRKNSLTDFQSNRNGSSANSFHHQRDTHSPRADNNSPAVESSGPPGLPHNARVNSPTQRRRNGSVAGPVHQRDADARRGENSTVVEFDAGLRPRAKDADNAIEEMLHRLDRLSEREIRAYQEQIRERTELQHSLRDCFNVQQKEYEHTFKEQHFKLLNITNERDELRRQVDTLRVDFLNMQKQLHQITSRDRPDAVAVVPASTFTPHTADGVSGQDLIRDTERLNDEIYQFAALLAEEFEKIPRERGMDARVELDVLRKLFGQNVADLVLQAKDQREHSMLVHAVQTCMISCCSGVLMTLLPCRKRSDSFQDIHRKIRKAESQGVSGQWRSLVYRHGLDVTDQEIFDSFKKNIWKLCEVFRLSSAMESTYRDSLKSIASKTFHLHKMIYAEVLSGDIKIISPESGTLFDPDTMEASEERGADAKSLRGRPIMCTTDMGLVKLVVDKVFSDEEYKFTEHKTTILKAKVFLSESSMADDEWLEVDRGS